MYAYENKSHFISHWYEFVYLNEEPSRGLQTRDDLCDTSFARLIFITCNV